MAGSAVIIGTGYDADDTSVGPIVGVSDERLEEFQVFAEHSAPSLMVKTLMTVAIRLTQPRCRLWSRGPMPRKVAIRAGRRDFGCRAWQERGRSIPDPVGQRRGRKLEALAFEPGALAGERHMHSILVEEGWSRADEDR